MLSYAHGVSDQPLLGETIGDNLKRVAARDPGAEALVSCHQAIRLDYGELDAATDRLAGALIAGGIDRGDRVAVWSPNRAEWAILQYACAKAGAILVNVNPAYRTSELAYALRQSGTRWIFTTGDFKGASFVGMVEEVRGELPELERAICFDDEEWRRLADHEADPAALAERMAALDCDDPVNIQYTSGTTGAPKGATLTHHNLLNNGLFIGATLRYSAADRICIPVPLYHCFGMVIGNLGATTHGACIVYPAEAFDAVATLRACAAERCTSLYGVPTMFIAELDHPSFGDHDLGSLRTGIMAGSPCPIEVMRRVSDEMGIGEMSIAFGMTETSPVTTMVAIDDTLEHRCATVGQVMPHAEIKIADPVSDATLGRGETGEFRTRGYMVMRGYWKDPERSAEAIDEAGWMHTGDLATMDEEGYVRIVGRIKDMVIRGGENVYPREIEEYLYGHPQIADVQVIGVPDARYGEELAAVVIVRAGAELGEEDVKEFCRGQIAHYKVPRYVWFVSEFPMTVTGKIQKFKLREAAIERFGLAEAAATA